MLPKITLPVYSVKIPSTKKVWKFNPFLVRDEKALLIAGQSEDLSVIVDTIKEVIKNCSKTDIDVDSLSFFDIEYMFLQLRSVSIGEEVNLLFACDHCDSKTPVAVNLKSSYVEDGGAPSPHSNRITIQEGVVLEMRYPDVEDKILMQGQYGVDEFLNIICKCIHKIYDNDQIIDSSGYTPEEIKEFVLGMMPDQFSAIKNFFDTMPFVRIDIDYSCVGCGVVHKKFMEGISNFF